MAYHKGKLYAGGYGQLGYFTGLDTPEPTFTSLVNQLPEPERGEEIWHVEIIEDGTVVYHSFARLYAFRNDELIDNQAPGILLFAHNEGGRLTIPVLDRGLLSYVPGTAPTLLPGSSGLAPRNVSNLVDWQSGYLIATEDTTFQLQDGRLTATDLPRHVNRLLKLRGGGLAAGTIDDGLYLLDEDLNITQHLTRERGLGNNTVLALHEDLAGNLWVGLDQGLTLVERSGALAFANTATAEKGTVYAALEFGNDFYLGTNQGLYRAGRVAQNDFETVPGAPGQVWQFTVVDSTVVCSHNNGTYVIESGQARFLPGSTGTWQTVPHPTLDNLHLQASYTGLTTLRSTSQGLEVNPVAGTGAPLRSLAWTGNSTVLAAHAAKGVYLLHLNEDLSGYAAIDTLDEGRLVKPFISNFGDTLLVQSLDGVFQYADLELTRLTTFRGVDLPKDALCTPGRLERGEWFLVQADRISLYRQGQLLGRFPIRVPMDYPALLPWGDNEYLLGLSEGYALLKPNGSRDTVPAMLLNTQQLGRDALRFQAALPVFDRPVRYRYRIMGQSEDWSEWSERAEFEFRGLWEGDYVFEVEADWSSATARQPFKISPPWYRSLPAYLIYILLGAGLLVFFYRLHRTRLQNQERRLELVRRRQLQQQQIEARNRELEEKVGRKNRELANTTLTLAKKNEMLLRLREELEKGRADKVRHLIERNLNNEEDWAIFEDHFNEVHDAYLRRLRQLHPKLTKGDLQLAAYLKMDLSSKEIAPLLHISLRGVENKRYRLRKKLDLEGEQNLNQYLQDL